VLHPVILWRFNKSEITSRESSIVKRESLVAHGSQPIVNLRSA